ncbi:MAG TPA: hypothetical protein VFB50_10560 [Chloroflexota bacterium]|nr:hypothetical protein [Chloroflexota bacterium]
MSLLINPEPVTFTSSLITRFMPAKIARSRLGRAVYLAAGYLPVELSEELVDAFASALLIESELRLAVLRRGAGRSEYLGVVSRKVITDAGVAAVVNAFRNTFELELFNYHGLGTGSTAEATAQTALVTELTTQYATDNTRPAGTQSAPVANQYQSVATITVDAAASVTEHGLFSQAAAPGGTLWDRSVFGALALNTGDAIVATYIATITSGG